MRPDVKFQVTVRCPVPADLVQNIAEAHALAIRSRSVHAVYQARALVMPVQNNPGETEKAPEIDFESIDGCEQS